MASRRTTYLPGSRLINVAGESHYQEALLALASPGPDGSVRETTEAVLVPEPANPHDPNAVKVEIDGSLVGYLPRAEAQAYVPLIGRLTSRGRLGACEAVIAGRAGSALGVFLKLPAPSEDLPGLVPRGAF